MKAKTTRRALLMSVLSLLLCVSMLVGTTFAWFTDEVTSGRNTIQAGNLDVVLEYWDGDSYEEVTSTTKLFNDAALWEPGYTEVAYLKISNAGSLALKYQLAVNVYNETLGKTKTGEDIKLSDYLQFKVVESNTDLVGTYASREAAQAAPATATKLQTYNSEVKPLDAKNEAGDNNYYDYVALIIYMPTTVDNKANHNGVNVPSVQMGVNLFATQKDAEEDSFSADYDKDAPIISGLGTKETPYLIADAAQLALIAQNIKNNVAVNEGAVAYAAASYKLMEDVDLAGQEWIPLGTGEHPFCGTFDGNGKTVRNVKLGQSFADPSSMVNSGGDYGYAYGFFGVIGWESGSHENEEVAIRNLNLDVSFETGDAYIMGGLIGADAAAHKGLGRNSSLACDIEISNVTVNGKVISTNESGATVGGIAGKLYTKGNIVINGCTNNAEVKGEALTDDNKVGGILGYYSGANSAEITNNINNGAVTSKSGRSAGCKASGICITGSTTVGVIISNNTNNGTITGTENAVAAIAFSGCDKPIYKMTQHITENNSNTGKLYTLNYQTFAAEEVAHIYLVYGGKSQTPANNTTDDVKYANGTPVLEINSIPWDGISTKAPVQDTDGYYAISSPAELAWLAAGDRSLTNVKLTADIDMQGVTIDPIDLNSYYSFEGNGKTISNVVVDGSGLFGNNQSIGSINNLVLDNITVNYAVSGEVWAGIVAGKMSGTYTDITVKNSTVNAPDAEYVGGITGAYYQYAMNGCKVENCTIIGSEKVGGLIGIYNMNEVYASVKLKDCSVTNVTVTATNSAKSYAGVLLGRGLATSQWKIQLENCSAAVKAGQKLIGQDYNNNIDVTTVTVTTIN